MLTASESSTSHTQHETSNTIDIINNRLEPEADEETAEIVLNIDDMHSLTSSTENSNMASLSLEFSDDEDMVEASGSGNGLVVAETPEIKE